MRSLSPCPEESAGRLGGAVPVARREEIGGPEVLDFFEMLT